MSSNVSSVTAASATIPATSAAAAAATSATSIVSAASTIIASSKESAASTQQTERVFKASEQAISEPKKGKVIPKKIWQLLMTYLNQNDWTKFTAAHPMFVRLDDQSAQQWHRFAQDFGINADSKESFKQQLLESNKLALDTFFPSTKKPESTPQKLDKRGRRMERRAAMTSLVDQRVAIEKRLGIEYAKERSAIPKYKTEQEYNIRGIKPSTDIMDKMSRLMFEDTISISKKINIFSMFFYSGVLKAINDDEFRTLLMTLIKEKSHLVEHLLCVLKNSSRSTADIEPLILESIGKALFLVATRSSEEEHEKFCIETLSEFFVKVLTHFPNYNINNAMAKLKKRADATPFLEMIFQLAAPMIPEIRKMLALPDSKAASKSTSATTGATSTLANAASANTAAAGSLDEID